MQVQTETIRKTQTSQYSVFFLSLIRCTVAARNAQIFINALSRLTQQGILLH